MTIRSTAIIITLIGLTLVLFLQDYGEINNSVRSRLTTSLRLNDNDNENNATTILGCNNTTTTPCSTLQATTIQQHDDFCSLFEDSPSQWWTMHFDDIVSASRHPQDLNFVYKNWTTSLLASLTPTMLFQGIRARPTGPTVDAIVDKVWKRISNPQEYPPVTIAAIGGSVTRGQGCYEPVLQGTRRMNATLCAWPSRLERLINTFAGMQVVKVYNLAVSATNLQFGIPLVKYWLYPPALLEQNGPDIIISSYSTNEQVLHVDTTKSPKYANQERERLQEFIHASRNDACNPPLLIFVDDYLGNRQDYILGETTFSKVTTELAEWYSEVMHVSYADVVRRHVYANTNESTFTSPWPLETSGKYKGQPTVDVHFGMGGHVAISFSVLFAMLDVARGYCDSRAFERKMSRLGHQGVFDKQVLDLVETVPPPDLTPSLLLSRVSREWQDKAVVAQAKQCNDKHSTVQDSPCVFAFLAGPDATVRNPQELQAYLQPHLIQNQGWKPVMEFGAGGAVEKPGLVAMHANASMTLHFTNIRKNLQVINLQRIKSYGTKWAGSKARFDVEISSPNGKSTYKTQFDVGGHHKYESSVSYPFEYDLREHKAVKGSNITLAITLVGGTTFKILGLMLCNN